MKEAEKRTGVSRAFINRARAEGEFPMSVQIGPKRIGFVEAEVNQWIQERIDARSNAA